MPSTRRSGDELMTGGDFTDDTGSDYDPDYREESADEDEDEIPASMARDRADWVVDNQTAIEELFMVFKDAGRELFGNAFFQCGSVTPFAHFVYKHTTPGAS